MIMTTATAMPAGGTPLPLLADLLAEDVVVDCGAAEVDAGVAVVVGGIVELDDVLLVEASVVEDESVVVLESVLVDESSLSSSVEVLEESSEDSELVVVATAGGANVFMDTDDADVVCWFFLLVLVLVASPKPSALSTALVRLSKKFCRLACCGVGRASCMCTVVICVLTIMNGCAAIEALRQLTTAKMSDAGLMVFPESEL